MMLAPTVDRFFEARIAPFFPFPMVLLFVFTVSSYLFAGYPDTKIGTNRFIALRSALLRFAFAFFGYADSRKSGSLSPW
jgi:hypothetical protein